MAYKPGRSVEESESVFGICPIVGDEELLGGSIGVLYGHNIADSENPEHEKSGEKGGKPHGWGMLGGGRKPEETKEEAMVREFRYEGGQDTLAIHEIGNLWNSSEPEPLGKYIYKNLRTGKVRFQTFAWKKRPEPTPSRGETHIILNPFRLFDVEIDWYNSELRKFFLEVKRKAVAEDPNAEEQIRHFGIQQYIDTDQADKLGIVEKNEINGVAIFTLKHLELEYNYPTHEFGKKGYFYKTHMEYHLSYVPLILQLRDIRATKAQEMLGQFSSVNQTPRAIKIEERRAEKLTRKNKQEEERLAIRRTLLAEKQ